MFLIHQVPISESYCTRIHLVTISSSFLGPTSLISRVRSVAPQLACCKLLFLSFNKILVAAILGNFRAFKVTIHVVRFFALFVADPWLGNAANGLERSISVITKVQRLETQPQLQRWRFRLVLRRTVSQYHNGIWRLGGRA